jgi:flavin-binding protein dodecin
LRSGQLLAGFNGDIISWFFDLPGHIDVYQSLPRTPDIFELCGKVPSCNSYALCSQLQNTVYKYIDIVGTSATGVNDAIKNAIEEGARTIKNLQWAELGQTTVRIEDQKILEYQTEVGIGFKVERSKNKD